MSLEQVQELMGRAYALPYGEARTVVTEEALRRAEELGDPRVTFDVRMELGSAYEFGGEPMKTFTTFSRCLAEYDADPGALGEAAEHRLLWQYKWIVYSLTQFPEVPLDRTRAALDDMERRYKLGGHSLQAVYGRRARVAKHLGNGDAADRWFAMWHTTPRDELSDCAGCDPTGKVSHLRWRGRDEEALAVAEPVLQEQLNCAEQPQAILTGLLPVFLRTGRLEDARNAHLLGYRLMRARLNELAYIGEHVEFCARTGNEARGLEIVQRHLGWLDRAPSPYAEMRFAASAALLLRRVEEAGHGDVMIARPVAAGGPVESVEVAVGELRAELAERALAVAARFDARNGNEHQSGLVRELLDAEPLADRLPLAQYDRPPTVTAPAPAAGPVPDHADVDDPDALLDIGQEEWVAGRIDRAAAAWRRFDELAADPTTLQAARRTDGEGAERFAREDVEGALAAWERASALYEEAGDPVARQAARSRIGAIRCGQGRPEEGLPMLRESADYLAEHAVGTRRAFTARMRLVGALLNGGDDAEAGALLEGVVPDGAEQTGELALMRARMALRADDTEAAVPLLEAAREAFRSDGDGTRHAAQLAEASLTLGRLLAQRGHRAADGHEEIFAAALEVFDEAVERGRAADPWMATAAHAERGTLLASIGRGEAIADLVEAVAGFTAAGAAPQAAYARLELAGAYYGEGRHLEAAETAEEALPLVASFDDPESYRRIRLILAHAQSELGEEHAAELFGELAAEAAAERNAGAAGELLELSAGVLTRLDKDAQAVERFLESAAAFEAAGNPYGVVRARRAAGLCHLWCGRPEEGLAEIERSRAALAGLPAEDTAGRTWEASRVAYDESRILAQLGRLPEALALVNEAIEGFASLDQKEAAETAAHLRNDIQEALNGENGD
ncbi:hypothetical protein [Actinomadura sp. 21ATH]|uniref:hypothetical protein n=1 Tax=Actinomadura sp. 21ATH TaxID=1735444 RepID=UPI0035BFC7A9